MADPQNKEMRDDIKRNIKEMWLFQTKILKRMERLKVGNVSKFEEIHIVFDILIQQTSSKQHHDGELHHKPRFR